MIFWTTDARTDRHRDTQPPYKSPFYHVWVQVEFLHWQLWAIFLFRSYSFFNGPIPASFCLFSLFSRYNFNNWKKRRWSAWDSNPGPQDGRRRWNHGAMAATGSFLLNGDAIPLLANYIVRPESSYLSFVLRCRSNPSDVIEGVLTKINMWIERINARLRAYLFNKTYFSVI